MLLKVKQVYNNNAVLVDVGNGKEAILQGKELVSASVKVMTLIQKRVRKYFI